MMMTCREAANWWQVKQGRALNQIIDAYVISQLVNRTSLTGWCSTGLFLLCCSCFLANHKYCVRPSPPPPAGKYEMSKCQLDGDERFKDINNFKSEQVWVLIFLKVCSPVPMTVMYVCVAITRHTRQLQTFFHSYVSSYVANVRHDKPSTKILPLKLIDKILLSWTNTQLDYWKQI